MRHSMVWAGSLQTSDAAVTTMAGGERAGSGRGAGGGRGGERQSRLQLSGRTFTPTAATTTLTSFPAPVHVLFLPLLRLICNYNHLAAQPASYNIYLNVSPNK